MTTTCRDRIPLETLLDYHLGALAEREDAFELHLFGCDACARRLALLTALGDGITRLAATGAVFASVTAHHLTRLAEAGLRLRSYRIAPGSSVHCTIAPLDDANVVRLAVDAPRDHEVDLVVRMRDAAGERQTDARRAIAIDRTAGEAVLLYPGDAIRALGPATFHLELRDADDDRSLGAYTMHHTPWGS